MHTALSCVSKQIQLENRKTQKQMEEVLTKTRHALSDSRSRLPENENTPHLRRLQSGAVESNHDPFWQIGKLSVIDAMRE